jgi:hypothetical protein
MAEGFVCQCCGIEAPTKYVEFYYNIGALVVRFTRSVRRYQCKRCIHKNFWKYTLLDLTLGWWGMISMIMTPIFLIQNISRYLGAMSLPSPPANAGPPVVTDREIAKLAPFLAETTARLNQKEPLNIVAQDIARRAGTTPGQVVTYLRMVAAPRTQPQPPVRGFPVVQNQAAPNQAVPNQPVAARPVVPPRSAPALPPIPLEPPAAPIEPDQEIGIR